MDAPIAGRAQQLLNQVAREPLELLTQQRIATVDWLQELAQHVLRQGPRERPQDEVVGQAECPKIGIDRAEQLVEEVAEVAPDDHDESEMAGGHRALQHCRELSPRILSDTDRKSVV